MARQLDLMLCIFPFEADLYNQSGLRTIFVGHPMIDDLPARKIDAPRDPNLIALLPGSRGREVRKIFPILTEVARDLGKARPHLRFEIAAASSALGGEMQKMLDRDRQDRHLLTIRVGATSALMQRAFAGIVASGSATLEATYFRMPFVLVYKVAWLTYLAARVVVKIKYLGMPNVLANREVVREFIQHEATPRAIAGALTPLLDEGEARRKMIFEFDEIVGKLGHGGASERAARVIHQEIISAESSPAL
jgi:lipid-A-disaccharide synthase